MSGDDDEAKPDLSPMIDCVFILLIFFIVTTVFVKEPKVEVSDPLAATAESLEKNSIIFAVTADNKVFYDGQSIGVAGVQQVVKPLLLEKSDPSEAHVIIKGDSSAQAGLVDDVGKECLEAGVFKNRITVSTES
ncbi:MAG: biopolymer transporter ExbD [Verrucomicrobiota bacterium JB023]|nr:biopolymer transporter ExbD [Verrucomicrobiota bacterium JB023]